MVSVDRDLVMVTSTTTAITAGRIAGRSPGGRSSGPRTEALVELNRQREKTPAQVVNEFEEILEIEKQKEPDDCGNVSTPPGKSRDDAAEKVNADVSGRTLEGWGR